MLDPKVQAAKALLKESDIDRIICIYLSSQNDGIDWNQAKRHYGANYDTAVFKYQTKKALKALETACSEKTGGSITTPPKSPNKASSTTASDDTSEAVGSPKLEKAGAKPKAKICKRGGGRKGPKGKGKVKAESADDSELSFDGLID